MPPIRWHRDVLTQLSRSALAERLPVSVRTLVARSAWRTGYAPTPDRFMHADLTEAFMRFLSVSEAEASRMALTHARTMYHAGLVTWTLMNSPRRGIDRFLDRHVRIQGEHHVLNALSAGPVILFSGHLGVPVVGAITIARLLAGRRTVNTFFAPPEQNPGTAGYRELIEQFGECMNALPIGARGVARAIRLLNEGHIVTMQPDVFDNTTGGALVVPFLDHLSYVMPGTAYMALKSGASLVPTHVTLEEGGQLRVWCGPAIVPDLSGDLDHDQYVLTCRIHEELERIVMERPEQWVYWRTLRERIVPAAVLPRARRHEEEAWRRAYESYRTLAGSVVPELGEAVYASV